MADGKIQRDRRRDDGEIEEQERDERKSQRNVIIECAARFEILDPFLVLAFFNAEGAEMLAIHIDVADVTKKTAAVVTNTACFLLWMKETTCSFSNEEFRRAALGRRS